MKSFKQILIIVLFGVITINSALAQDTTLTVTNNTVGVGTTTPQRRLVVSRDGQNPEINTLDGNLAAVFTSASFTGLGIMAGKEASSYIHFGDKDSGIAGGVSYNHSTDAMLLHTNLKAGITIDKNSNVGIGTETPQRRLVVSRDGQNPEINILDGNLAAIFTSAGFTGVGIMAGKEAGSFIHFGDEEAGNAGGVSYNNVTDALSFGTTGLRRLTIDNAGNVGIGTEFLTPSHPLEMASGAHVTAGGVWTNASSRSLKENIAGISADEAISALNMLEPVQYNYKREKNESYLGFIAEDVPEIVATKDRKSLSPMDIVALLTKVVQEQQKQIDALNARLDGGR